MSCNIRALFVFLTILVFSNNIYAQANEDKKESPWLITPLISSGPKMGTSAGLMTAYMHKFDENSPTSMFAIGGNYSSTDSLSVGIFTRTYFDNDVQRISAGIVHAKINNEYNDFLGSGLAVSTTDDLNAGFLRYQYRVMGDWFVGAQVMSADYMIIGSDAITDAVLEFIGLSGFKSTGVGLIIERDTRDNQHSPSAGSRLLISNMAYREAFGGEASFDAYDLKTSKYFSQHNGNVLAVRLEGRWTDDAPKSAYSTVTLRGYSPGQYLAPYSTTFEIEERFSLNKKWGIDIFTGVAALYGNGTDWFPSVGTGVNYMLKAEEKMIVRLDIASGNSGNYGVYLKFGREF